MSEKVTDLSAIEVRLATSPDEILESQKLRYKVFYEEYGAKPCFEMEKESRDFDSYDPISDHLIVLDNNFTPARIVGTYRLLRKEQLGSPATFYTSDEYDISPLLSCGETLLELGRSCVLPPYRTRPILQKLWEGIAHYVVDHKIGLMFGCASLHGTDIDELSTHLAYLYHYHLAPDHLCPRAVEGRFVDMNLHEKESLNAKRAFVSLPPLIKGYIRLGGSIGNGAVVDEQFNTTDVCIVMPTEHITGKYIRHYERVTQKNIPGNAASSSAAGE